MKEISLLAYLIGNGVSIPHYCYHTKLSIAGNCRICLVELEKSVKPVVSSANILDMVFNKNNKLCLF